MQRKKTVIKFTEKEYLAMFEGIVGGVPEFKIWDTTVPGEWRMIGYRSAKTNRDLRKILAREAGVII